MSEEMVNYQVSPEMATQKQEIKTGDIQDQITSLIPLAGTIELTPEQEGILYAPVDPGSVEIRSDGLIYLPWMEYVARLRGAFGMSWTLIPYGPPKKMGSFIHWAFWLIIRGKPYGFAVGEQAYFENGRMTYGDALEGCKSNALMRLCKGLGISNELWRPSFVKEWKAKYAEVYGKDKGKDLWRKKGVVAEAVEKEEDIPLYPVPPAVLPETAMKNFKFLQTMGAEKKRVGQFPYYETLRVYGFGHANEIVEREKQEIIYKALKELIAVNLPPK